MIKFNRILATLVAVVFISVVNPVYAASQCSGLSSSKCTSKSNECTWRKSSVNKNGVTTKAHCRALPGKSKNVVKNAVSSKKATSKKSVSKVKDSAKKKASSTKSKTTSKKSMTKSEAAAAKKAAIKAKAESKSK